MFDQGDLQERLPAEALRHYETTSEAGRLSRGPSQLELARTQELLLRYLPPPPATVLDVGGGPGVYACWLARQGYTVHLVDAVLLHVEQARHASAGQPEYPLASAALGDARQLEWADSSVDAVLLLGPLYHLIERQDRVQALREARRVVRQGNLVFAAAITRFASAFDGLFYGFLDDPAFIDIVRQDLADGQHRNPTNNPTYFTTTFFHHPDEVKPELEDAGLQHEVTLAIEGIARRLPDFDAWWQDPVRRERLLTVTRWLESEPSLLGASAHLLAIGRKS